MISPCLFNSSLLFASFTTPPPPPLSLSLGKCIIFCLSSLFDVWLYCFGWAFETEFVFIAMSQCSNIDFFVSTCRRHYVATIVWYLLSINTVSVSFLGKIFNWCTMEISGVQHVCRHWYPLINWYCWIHCCSHRPLLTIIKHTNCSYCWWTNVRNIQPLRLHIISFGIFNRFQQNFLEAETRCWNCTLARCCICFKYIEFASIIYGLVFYLDGYKQTERTVKRAKLWAKCCSRQFRFYWTRGKLSRGTF